MGWTFPNATLIKAAIIRYRIQPQRSSDGWTQTVIAHHVVDDTLWKVIETSLPRSPLQRYLGLDIPMQSPHRYGYKDLDESRDPYAYTCPLSFLAITPVQNSAWRAKVHEHHASRQAQITLLTQPPIEASLTR